MNINRYVVNFKDSKRMMKERNLQINGLRSILIVFVALYHFFTIFGRKYIGGEFYDLNIIPGQASVCAFIFLSGWFLCIGNVSHFWLKKLFKIIIPAIIAIFVIFGIRILFSSFKISILDLSMNIFLIPMVTNLFDYVDGAHWYIVALVYFFIIYTIIVFIQKLVRKNIDWIFLTILMIICLVIGVFIKPTNDFFRALRCLFPSYFAIIVCGFLAKKIYSMAMQKQISYCLTVIISISIALVSSFACYWNYGFIQLMYYLLLLLPLIILTIFKKIKILEYFPFQIIGTGSFWIYLLHQEIGFIIIKAFLNLNIYWVGIIIAFISMFTLGIIISVAWNKYIIEKILNDHILRKKSHLTQ